MRHTAAMAEAGVSSPIEDYALVGDLSTAALIGRRMAEMRVPITIVPGTMTKEDIIAAT